MGEMEEEEEVAVSSKEQEGACWSRMLLPSPLGPPGFRPVTCGGGWRSCHDLNEMSKEQEQE